jgi:RNA polymerase sigma-70 factor (ECF subfamily)
VIVRSVLRIAAAYGNSNRSLIDDLVQETYLKICAHDCKLLQTFVPQQPDSAFGFIKMVATNVALDYFKSRHADKRAPEMTAETIEDIKLPCREVGSSRDLNRAERAVLIDQIDRKIGAVVPADELARARKVFWLYYRAGFTASAIASMPTLELTTKGVESMLFRLTRLVRDQLSELPDTQSKGQKGLQQAESF